MEFDFLFVFQMYEKILRAKAVSIVHACISVLGSMSGVYQVGRYYFYLMFSPLIGYVFMDFGSSILFQKAIVIYNQGLPFYNGQVQNKE